jgi:hypothetical protein
VPVQVVSIVVAHHSGYLLPMEAQLRTMIATLAGLTALAAVSAQAALNPSNENWVRLGPAALSFGLGDQGCGEGWHQSLRRDWLRDWWWGPCVQNR